MKIKLTFHCIDTGFHSVMEEDKLPIPNVGDYVCIDGGRYVCERSFDYGDWPYTIEIGLTLKTKKVKPVYQD